MPTLSFFIIFYLCSRREDEDSPEKHGHITSLAVSKNYRRLGLAEKLMRQAGIKYTFEFISSLLFFRKVSH